MPEIPGVLLLVAVGLVLGSFLNVCMYRLPQRGVGGDARVALHEVWAHTEMVREPSRPGIRGTGWSTPNMRRAYLDDVSRG